MNMHEAGTLAFVIPVVNHGFQLMEPSHVSADNLTPQTNSMLRNDLSKVMARGRGLQAAEQHLFCTTPYSKSVRCKVYISEDGDK